MVIKKNKTLSYTNLWYIVWNFNLGYESLLRFLPPFSLQQTYKTWYLPHFMKM